MLTLIYLITITHTLKLTQIYNYIFLNLTINFTPILKLPFDLFYKEKHSMQRVWLKHTTMQLTSSKKT